MILLTKVRLINWYGVCQRDSADRFLYADRRQKWKREIGYAGRD